MTEISAAAHEAAHHHGAHHHGADHHDAHHHDGDHPESTLKGYLTGFGLSVILTAIPFWLVMNGVLDKQATALVIMAFAIVQIVVHMVFFLHMSAKSEGGWTMMALIFTLVLVVIALTGSLWVMYHLTTNMTPSIQDMRQMP